MAKIHMVLQGKGGVGKTHVSSLMAQALKSAGLPLTLIDTDPVNSTFFGYKSLNVVRLAITDGNKELGYEINPRKLDTLFEMVANAPPEMNFVIDNGAATFVPLSHYLISNQVPALLHQMGHELIVHTVISGGQALLDTLNGFSQLASQFPKEAKFVVWLNPYWGPVESEGKRFEQMKAYGEHKSRIAAMVTLPQLNEKTFGADLADMLQKRQTFEDALGDSTLPIMVRQRLTLLQRDISDRVSVLLSL